MQASNAIVLSENPLCANTMALEEAPNTFRPLLLHLVQLQLGTPKGGRAFWLLRCKFLRVLSSREDVEDIDKVLAKLLMQRHMTTGSMLILVPIWLSS